MNLNPNSKKILCYGDSNTWGYIPCSGERYDVNTRWTGVLQKLLGEDFWILENGLNGRTTEEDDNKKPWRNGAKFLVPLIQSQNPIDLVILFLGTNDLKEEFNKEPKDIAKSIENLIKIIQEYAGEKIKIILISPTIIDFSKINPNWDFRNAEIKSKELPKLYKEIAEKNNCEFLDLSKIISPSPKDGLHLEREAHKIIADNLYSIIKKIF